MFDALGEFSGERLIYSLLAGGLMLIFLFAFGVRLGLRKTIVVYRNHYDVLLVGMLYMLPIAFLVAFAFLSDAEGNGAAALQEGLLAVGAALTGLLGLLVVIRTWRDNPHLLKMMMALFVKIPLGMFFFMHFYNIFDAKKSADRRKSIFWALLLVPLLHGLVRDRSGRLPGIPRGSR